MTKKQKLFFTGIIALAIFFRFWGIFQMPGGLFPDEAANGLDINSMQSGQLQPFYERGNGREALFFYFEWASTAAFGKGQWEFHITSAFFGVLAVIMCFFVTFRLFLMDAFAPNNTDSEGKKRRAINIALLAAFLMAVSSWHVVLSHTAFRATLIPLFSALTFYFLLRTYQARAAKTRFWFAFLFGASFALGFYTYIAFRIMVPILAMVLMWPLLAQIKQKKFWRTVINYKLLIISSLLAFVIFIFPLAKYFYQHPGSFIGRAGQVSIFNQTLYTADGIQLTSRPPLGVVIAVAGEVFKTQMLGFFTHGDLNWRQNISGYPFLSPLVSPFFGIGLAVMLVLGIWYFFAPLKREGWWKYYLLVGWFFGMLLPVISTAEGIPHGLRGIGVIPPVFIISSWALYNFGELVYKYHKRIWEKCWCHLPFNSLQKKDLDDTAHPHFSRFKLISWALKSVVVFFCLALIAQTYFLYFVYAANSPEYFYYFRADLTPVSKYLVDRCNQSLQHGSGSTKNSTFLVLDKFSVQTTDYLTSDPKGNFSQPCNVPYIQTDPENAWQLPKILPGQEVVFTQSSIFDTKKFKQYHPEARLSMEIRNKFEQTVMAVYKTY